MRIFKQIIWFIILPLGLGAWSLTSWATLLKSGKPAPDFIVKSGDNQKLSLNMVRGKVVVLFYESRHSLGQNHELKNVLTRFYLAQPANIRRKVFRLVVIDCSQSMWPTTPIWKRRLRESSGEEGFTIYGDWNRKMLKDYRMKAEESNFLIIDKYGIIRYSAAGKVPSRQFQKIKKLLLALVHEQP